MSFRPLAAHGPRSAPARRLARALAVASIVLLGGCAFLSRPHATTTLRLSDPPEALAWPPGVMLGRVTAATELRSDRVVVADGALLMQHPGVRWVDAPAVILSEYLRRLRVGPQEAAFTQASSLDLWLTEFNMSVSAGGARIVVGLSAQLRCASGAWYVLPSGRNEVLLAGESAQSIAAGFSTATAELVSTTLAAASLQQPRCRPPEESS